VFLTINFLLLKKKGEFAYTPHLCYIVTVGTKANG
jgi:hypothetical protein